MMPHDCTFINSNVAVGGGIFVDSGMKELKRLGITHIIDCQAEWDDTPSAKKLGIEVLWVPAIDDYSTIPDFPRVAAFIEQTIEKNKDAKFFVHCAAGVHRGPMYGLLTMLVLNPKMSVTRAEYLITSHRLIADFPLVYEKAVETFIEGFRKAKQLP